MLSTRLYTWLRGQEVGRDAFGNRYYERAGKRGDGAPSRRWVMFVGAEDASSVPAEWHAWLHYTTDAPLTGPRHAWQKPHQPNLTGTPGAYRPPGHDYEGGRRPRTAGDYEAWSPEGDPNAASPEGDPNAASPEGDPNAASPDAADDVPPAGP